MSTAPRPTKADQREEARATALRLREQQQAVVKRQRTIAIAATVVGLAVLGFVVAYILGTANASALADVERPAGSTDSGAIPVGPDGVAGSTAGAAQDATVISVYADYLCPFCASFEISNGAVLDELRATGEVVVEYHPVSILDGASAGSVYSTRAAGAAAFVADQAPEAFLDFNLALFMNQPAEGIAGLSNVQIAGLAREAGVSDDVAARIEDGSFVGEGDGEVTGFKEWVAAATEQASKDLGSLTTPTILIDGEKVDTEVYDWRLEGQLAAAVADAGGPTLD